MSGDFLPGYVATLTNPTLNSKLAKFNIIVIGFENGKIYYGCDTTEEFFSKIAERKNKQKLLIYYKNITFTDQEIKTCWNSNIWLMNDAGRQKVIEGFGVMQKIIFY